MKASGAQVIRAVTVVPFAATSPGRSCRLRHKTSRPIAPAANRGPGTNLHQKSPSLESQVPTVTCCEEECQVLSWQIRDSASLTCATRHERCSRMGMTAFKVTAAYSCADLHDSQDLHRPGQARRGTLYYGLLLRLGPRSMPTETKQERSKALSPGLYMLTGFAVRSSSC